MNNTRTCFHRFGKRFALSFFLAICVKHCAILIRLKKHRGSSEGISLMFIQSTDSGRPSESLVVSGAGGA